MAVRKGCARSTGGAPLCALEALHRGAGEEPRLEGPEDDLDPAGRALLEEAIYWPRRSYVGQSVSGSGRVAQRGRSLRSKDVTDGPGQVNRRVSLSLYGDSNFQGRGLP